MIGFVTGLAAESFEVDAWDAVIRTLPFDFMVAVAPEIERILGLLLVNLTGIPAESVAVRTSEPLRTKETGVAGLNVMVGLPLATTILLVTGAAGL